MAETLSGACGVGISLELPGDLRQVVSISHLPPGMSTVVSSSDAYGLSCLYPEFSSVPPHDRVTIPGGRMHRLSLLCARPMEGDLGRPTLSMGMRRLRR